MPEVNVTTPSVQSVAQLVLGALNAHQVPHGVAIDALFALYRGLALKFPCCTTGAAINCTALCAELLAVAQANGPAAARGITTH